MEQLNIHRVDDKLKHLYMDLLIIGDESEKMIARYTGRGTLYAGNIGDKAVAVCMVTEEAPDTVEVKNLAVAPEFRRRGIGRQMLSHIESLHHGKTIQLGTGETP